VPNALAIPPAERDCVRVSAAGHLRLPQAEGRPLSAQACLAADALRYSVEDLRMPKAFGAWLEVGDERFSSVEIQRLYEAEDYSLRKP
jgi:hypothetical protein